MPALRNAFKYRLADRPLLDTSLFLHLYCPALLNRLSPEDFAAPRLLVLRGSPGSGKSSFLRLFQTESLTTLHSRRALAGDDILAELLRELGVLGESSVRVAGLYIPCDSNLRDVANVDSAGNLRLLNALLDVRITLAYLRSLGELSRLGLLPGINLSLMQFDALTADETPPPLFAQTRTYDELYAECVQIETDFAALLNSFPGDTIPASIRPHARLFSLSFLGALRTQNAPSPFVTPLVLIDDLQDLYEEQRIHLQTELLRRVGIPRWVAVRKHVYELERLLPLEGTKDERDVREIDLDATTAPAFRKFLENVTERRLRQTEPLRQFTTVQDFRDHLKEPDLVVTKERVVEKLSSAITELKQRSGSGLPNDLVPPDQISFDYLVEIERLLILAERKNRRRQQFLLAELEPPEPSDAKTEEAARLFASQRYRFPYYFSFDALCQAANGNVEQFLAIASPYVDKMIFRAELGRAPVLNAGEQEELLRQSADRYYQRIEQGFAHGFNIRQFIDNLGIFCKTVTHRPNAPIAPGVTGFGLTREQLRDALSADGAQEGLRIFRQTLTSAVAGNVLAVRSTKQGQAGSKKLVFYLNRLLCIRFGLPMNYGGWQRLPIENLVKMMRGPVPAEEWGKKWKPEALTLEEAEV